MANCEKCTHKVVCGKYIATGGNVRECEHYHEDRADVYAMLLARYGEQMQSVVAIEELSECQKEICKFLRNKGNTEHLAEEVADATIMLEQIQHIYKIGRLVSRYIDAKMRRTIDRLEETT